MRGERLQEKAGSAVSGLTHKLLSKPGLSDSLILEKEKVFLFKPVFDAKHFSVVPQSVWVYLVSSYFHIFSKDGR